MNKEINFHSIYFSNSYKAPIIPKDISTFPMFLGISYFYVNLHLL